MAKAASKTPTLDAIIKELKEQQGADYFLDLSDAERVTTEELFCVLEKAGIPCTKEELEELSGRHLMSDGIYDELFERYGADPDECFEVAFPSLMVLCKRLLPDWVSVDTYNTRVSEAHDLQRDLEDRPDDVMHGEMARALCRAWEMAVKLADLWGVSSVAEFDKKAQDVYSIVGLARDLDDELDMASRFDPSFAKTRRDFILEFARLFGRESIRVLEVCVEPDGTILAELGMYMDDTMGVVFDGVIDDELLDDPYLD